ncbi:MAG: flagellar basal body-associated FliL family protein [Bdellovibrionales bacterium]|nr:flagellar basal body-associated FliL family protein [Bdellovibrionales bacterium]
MAEEDKKEAEKDQADANAAEGSAKKSKTTLLLIIGGVLVLVLAIGAPVLYLSLKPKPKETHLDPAAAANEHKFVVEGFEEEEEFGEDEEVLGAIYPLETFVVNISGDRYIRLQIQLEFNTRDIPRRFYATLVPVRDSLITLLTTRTVEDLTGEQAKENLKDDIKDVVNETMKKVVIKNVYFTQFVIQ